MSIERTTAKVRSIMDRLTNEIRTELVRRGHKATGSLSQSVRVTVLSGQTFVVAEGRALDHWKYVGNGRGPGKQPPTAPIRRWLRAKGQDERLAFPIARKIGREGSKDFREGNENVFGGKIREFQEQRRFYLGKEIASEVREQILEDFTKLKAA